MDSSEAADSPRAICDKTYQSSKAYSYKMCVLYFIIYFAIMLTYAITVNAQEESTKEAIGWMNFLLILVTDGTLLGKLFHSDVITTVFINI
jgi:hypothetical protein